MSPSRRKRQILFLFVYLFLFIFLFEFFISQNTNIHKCHPFEYQYLSFLLEKGLTNHN